VTETTTPYLEVFGCHDATEDGCKHEDVCAYGFTCGTCGRPVDDGPCPDHAPLNVPGLVLAECDATPRHPHTFFFASEAYPPPCMYCSYDALRREHAPCRHSHHGAWRSWDVTHAVLHRLRMLGAVSGGWMSWDEHCRGCVSHLRLGGSTYVLGWPKWKWSCVLRGHHWPGVLIFADICGKCCPCPGCSSVTNEHRSGCPVGVS
jgi:hypothetical protein